MSMSDIAAFTKRPQTGQTDWQYEIEAMYADAVNAESGLRVACDAEVPESVRAAVIALARKLVPYIDAPTRLNPDQYGIQLTRTKRPDGEPYIIALVTHQTTASKPRSSNAAVLLDGAGPSPDFYLDGFRFLAAYRGLLRLLEREIVHLRDCGDWNWNAGDTPDDSPPDPEEWHPDEMLRHVRRMRREVQRSALVDEVHHRGHVATRTRGDA